jgi:hypothetical protein
MRDYTSFLVIKSTVQSAERAEKSMRREWKRNGHQIKRLAEAIHNCTSALQARPNGTLYLTASETRQNRKREAHNSFLGQTADVQAGHWWESFTTAEQAFNNFFQAPFSAL